MLSTAEEITTIEPSHEPKVDKFFSESKPIEGESSEDFEQRQVKQRQILNEVSIEDLVEAARSQIQAQESFRERYDKPKLTEEEKTRQTRGSIFETLSNAQYMIDEKREPSELSLSILEIYKNPPEALRDAVGELRNPDLIDIRETEGGEFVITGAAEVKLGKLDYRFYEQMSAFGDSLDTLIETLQEFKNTNYYVEGYEDLIDSADTLKVRPGRLARILLVPTNRDTEDYHNLINLRDFEEEGLDDVVEDLKYDVLPEVDIRNTAFSIEDVGLLTQVVSQSV